VIVGTKLTATLKLPDFETSCVDVAVIVAVPAEAGVKTPTPLTLPIVNGLTDQLTVLLKFPVPTTDCVQLVVWFVRMDAEEQAAETELTVEYGTIMLPLKQPVIKRRGIMSAKVAAMDAAHEGLPSIRLLAECRLVLIRHTAVYRLATARICLLHHVLKQKVVP
jgi:hypothetical protein